MGHGEVRDRIHYTVYLTQNITSRFVGDGLTVARRSWAKLEKESREGGFLYLKLHRVETEKVA